MKTKFKSLTPIVFALFAMSSCNFLHKDNDWEGVRKEIDGDDAVMPTSISLNIVKMSLTAGQTAQLKPTFTPVKCNKSTKWYTSSPASVSVDDEGNIYAKSAGSAVVSAISVNGLEARCEIEVSDFSITKVKVETNNVTLHVGDLYRIENAVVEPYTADAKIGYTVPANSIENLSVDKNGVVRTLKKGIGTVIVYYDANQDGRYNQNIEIYTNITFNIIEDFTLTATSTTAIYYPSLTADLSGGQNISVTKFDVTKSIPYLSTSQLNTIVKKYLTANYGVDDSITIYKKYTSYYAFELNGGSVRFYPDRNQVVLHDWDKYASLYFGTNNGLRLDPCFPTSASNFIDSKDTEIVKAHAPDVVINLGEYNLRIFEYNNLCYIPFDLAVTLLLHDMGSLVYDGSKIFDPVKLSPEYGNETLFPAYYSSSNAFAYHDEYYGKLVFVQRELNVNETDSTKYVYETTNPDDYGFYMNGEFRFYTDGTGRYTCGINTSGSNSIFIQDFDRSDWSFTYSEDLNNGNITVTIDESYGGGTFIINKRQSNFASNSFQEGYKMYAYNCFALKLDYFYGLKYRITHTRITQYFREYQIPIYKVSYFNQPAEVIKMGSVYDLIDEANTIEDYSKVMAGLFAGLLGDGHSSLTCTSLLGRACQLREQSFSKYSYSDRLINLDNRANSLIASKKAGYELSSNSDNCYKDTANKIQIMQFSQFAGSVIPANTELSSITGDAYVDYSFNSADDGKFGVNEETYKNIAKKLSELSSQGTIKNIVFDITLNGGGSVRQLPQLLGLMTEDPTILIRNTLTGGVTEFHYQLDLNGDGKYGTTDDTFRTKFNFYILQSSYSFSCASAFAASAKINKCATVVGDEFSGGGACIVSYGTDAIGNTYTMSSSLEFLMPDEEGYDSDDDGVYADVELLEQYFYNPDLLVAHLPDLKS